MDTLEYIKRELGLTSWDETETEEQLLPSDEEGSSFQDDSSDEYCNDEDDYSTDDSENAEDEEGLSREAEQLRLETSAIDWSREEEERARLREELTTDEERTETQRIKQEEDLQDPFNPQEISQLMTHFYYLLAKMHYFPESYIKLPPHDPAVNTGLAESLGLEPQVIELLQQLPYLDGVSHSDEFINYGGFADFRTEKELERSRDPMYACPEGGWEDENGLYMRQWTLPLNNSGNRGALLYLDTRTNRITMVSFYGGTADPALYEQYTSTPNEPYVNKNSFQHLPSRPAKELLLDLMVRFVRLEWIPFDRNGWRSMYGKQHGYDYLSLKNLFSSNGWPENFEDAAFDLAAAQWRESSRVRFEAENPERTLKAAEGHETNLERFMHAYTARLRDGTWDDNEIYRPSDGDADIQQELDKKKEELERTKESVREASEAYKDYPIPEERMAVAWKGHVQGEIDRKVNSRRLYAEHMKRKGREVDEGEVDLSVAEKAEVDVLREKLSIAEADLTRVRLTLVKGDAEDGLKKGSRAWEERLYAYRPSFFDDERFSIRRKE